jgi:hypothetical protein
MDRKSKNAVEEDRAGFSGLAGPLAVPPASVGERDWNDDWVHELIAMTRPGVEIQFPAREINERQVPFVYDDFR